MYEINNMKNSPLYLKNFCHADLRSYINRAKFSKESRVYRDSPIISVFDEKMERLLDEFSEFCFSL